MYTDGKRKIPIYCFAALLLILHCASYEPVEYRVDSQEQFMALSIVVFHPGDTILFKRGMQFDGMFAPFGNGTKRAPIKVKAYGKGPLPRINANGKHIAGLLLHNLSFWEIYDLEITNTDGTDEDQGRLYGIYVVANGIKSKYKHIYINGCYIHDINGLVAGKRRGGIHVHTINRSSTIFHDLRIIDNRIVRIGGVGIGNAFYREDVKKRKKRQKKKKTFPRKLWTRVYVAGNYIDNTGRNNIIARVSKDAVYEYNTLANSSRYSTGHSIYCFGTDGIKIQYNEAYGNVGKSWDKDRGGFDADFNCKNTVIQYNYSHDNDWFCGIMKKSNGKVTIRYNVSQNDKKGIYYYGFEDEKKAENIHVYNNTHFVRKGLNVKVFPKFRTPLNSLFENNIFYFEGEGGWGRNAKGINLVFRNNLYFNISPHESDTRAKTGDPLFVNPGSAGTNIDLRTMQALKGYRLMPQSPYKNAAITIKDNGGKDILKTKVVHGRAAIGAFESVHNDVVLTRLHFLQR